MSRRTAVAVSLLAVCAALAPSARATTAANLCPAAADPCNVSQDIAVGAGSVLDVGSRALVIKRGNTLDVGSGTMTIKARSLTIEPGASIVARGLNGMVGGGVTIVTTGDVTLQVDGNSHGRMDVSGDGSGGSIGLTVGGNLLIDGDVFGKGTTIDGDGGSLDAVVTGSVTVHGDLDFTGGSQSEGGDVSFTAGGPVVVTRTIVCNGGDVGGGSVDIDSRSTVSVASLAVDGGGSGGDGGFITVTGDGDVTIGGSILASGAGQADSGGDGGDIEVISKTTARVLGQIVAPSGDSGSGGGIDVEGLSGDVIIAAALKANGIGTDSCGGEIMLIAANNLSVGDMDASGASCGGGNITATAVNGTAAITGEADADGGAGSFTLSAEQISITGNVHADAGQGKITLRGCLITVGASGRLTTAGTNGLNLLQAGGQIQVSGTVVTGGTNRFEYRTVVPLLGGSISPAPQVAPNATINPCRVAPCGNGTIDAGEGCDDGNNEACDGCSPTCRQEVCGNGVVDCGEQCDGGSQCDATCHVITVGGLLFLPGRPAALEGCYLEWGIRNPNGPVVDGFPSRTQPCIDGDPNCDGDGANDGQCTFQVKTCMHVNDARLPDCQLLGIINVSLRKPDAFDPADQVDADNAAALLSALESQPVEVRVGSTIVRPGNPNYTIGACSPLVDLRLPHDPGLPSRRSFTLAAQDILERRMRSNQLELECLPNPAVCGNGATEIGEQCDDGNTQSCDGCSSVCRTEACGNGVLECAEECDDGAANGTPGATCTATCTLAPPPLRISGGGRGAGECNLEWAMALGTPAPDKLGNPNFKQSCTDGDSACDFSALPNVCRFHLWICLGGADARYACAADQVSQVDLLKPNQKAKPPLSAVRSAVLSALTGVGIPAGPGEMCTRRLDVDVTAGRRALTLRTRALGLTGTTDKDVLKLRCDPSVP